MKRSLCIGIYDLSPAWESILDQIGVWYHEITTESDLFSSFSLIIVNQKICTEKIQKLNDYLNQGGNIIFINDDHGFMPNKRLRRKYLKRVYNDLKLYGFYHIPYLDLYTRVKTNGSAQLSGLIRFNKKSKGHVACIGFDPADLIFRTRYQRKQFLSTDGDEPDEIVNEITKGYLSDLFLQIVKELHFRTGLPLIRKWTSPDIKPVFCFRIDSDYSDKHHIDKLYSKLNKHNIKATWFLHVKAHENWLEHFKEFQNQEIALHGYRHGTSTSESKVTDNINEGLYRLTKLGFDVNGYCAPYGIYNNALKRSLDHFEFKYTSEFTYAYDSFPIKTQNGPLQVPIHPICTGSLNRKGYDKKRMLSYFHEVMDRKIENNLPVVFYHHPLQPGSGLFESIFNRVNEEEITNLTFGEYADFWYRRQKCSFKAYVIGNNIQFKNVSDTSQLFELFYQHDDSQLVVSKNSGPSIIKKRTIEHNLIQANELTAKNQGLINKIRLLKTSILDFRNRKRL